MWLSVLQHSPAILSICFCCYLFLRITIIETDLSSTIVCLNNLMHNLHHYNVNDRGDDNTMTMMKQTPITESKHVPEYSTNKSNTNDHKHQDVQERQGDVSVEEALEQQFQYKTDHKKKQK